MTNSPDDKAKKAAYMRAWHHARKSDPEYRANLRNRLRLVS